MGYTPIPRVAPKRRLSRLEKAEQTIADAKELYAIGDLDLDRFEEIAENEYRIALRVPKMDQLEAEFRRKFGYYQVFEPVELVSGDGERSIVAPPKPSDAARSVRPAREPGKPTTL